MPEQNPSLAQNDIDRPLMLVFIVSHDGRTHHGRKGVKKRVSFS